MSGKDLISGLVTPIVIIASTLSYAALIFSGPLAKGLPVGIGYGLICAAVMAIAFALFSDLPFAIAGPDSKPAAVLATFAAGVAADLTHRGHAAEAPLTVMVALIAGTLITGTALYLLGVLKAGRWIRFVPYPVTAGFMAASGWLLAAGSIRLVIGTHGPHLVQLLVVAGFTTCLFIVKRFRHPLALPALLVGGTIATHVALEAAGYSLSAAQAQGWFPDLSAGAALPAPWLLKSLQAIDLPELLWSAGGYVGLIAVTAMTLLMSVMAIELETQLDIDLDKELKLNGLANIAVGLGGGMAGTLSLSRTLFNFRSGARGRSSGIMAGVICLLVLAFGTKALGYVPVPLMAALLLQLGISMLVEWLIRGWRTMQHTEYFEMAVIFIVTVAWDFVAGVVLGVITSCIAFAINTSRMRLLKLGLSRAVYSGSVDRPFYEQEQLVRYGHGIQIMWLHGFVFFGSAHRLLLQIREIVDVPGAACRSLILDFRQVMGIDSSAVMSLTKLRQIAERKGFDVVLAAVPPQVMRGLRTGGLSWSVFPDTDSALEWCEEKLLAERTSSGEGGLSADNWLASEIGSEELLPRLVSYLEVKDYKAGDYLIRQGEAGDSLYLLFAGRATVLLRTAQGAEIRLRTMIGHTIVGEMGLYRALPRGASVRADQVTIAYRMSKEAMEKMESEDPALAYAFHKLVIRTLAARLDFANREVAGLRR